MHSISENLNRKNFQGKLNSRKIREKPIHYCPKGGQKLEKSTLNNLFSSSFTESKHSG